MNRIFDTIQEFDTDVYFCDFTEYQQTHHSSDLPAGVLISENACAIISSFHILNPNKIKILAINFEQHLGVFKDEHHNLIAQCECMAFSERNDHGKGWLMLLELKYCLEKNIQVNVEQALSQLVTFFLYLRDEKQMFQEKEFHNFLIFSIPEYSKRVPFTAFITDPDILLQYQEKFHVTIWGETEVKALTTRHLVKC